MGHLVRLHSYRIGALTLLFLACGDGSSPKLGIERRASTADAGGGEESVAPAEGSLEAVPFEIVDEADSPCAPTGGGSRTVISPSIPALLITDLTRAGDRWLANGAGDEGFITFDPDGNGVSQAPLSLGDLNRAAGLGGQLLLATTTNDGVAAALFSPFDQQVGGPSLLSTDRAYYLAVGSSDARALVAWSTGTDVRARVVEAGGAVPAQAFALETDSAQDSWSASISAADDGEFAIMWTDHRQQASEWRGYFAFASSRGIRGLARNLFTQDDPMSVVKIVKREGGYAALVNTKLTTAAADVLVLPLDAYGRISGKARRFVGARTGLGLAANGGELGLVAFRTDGGLGFRSLDGNGVPIAPWRCVDTGTPDRDRAASVHADSAGYAVIRLAPDGATKLIKLDRLGGGL